MQVNAQINDQLCRQSHYCTVAGRGCKHNVFVGIIGTLFGHLLAVEIAMFRFVSVRNRVVGECQVVNSHCKMKVQLLECEFACVVFSYGSISVLQQQLRRRNRSAQLIRYAQLFQQQHYMPLGCNSAQLRFGKHMKN